MTHDELKQKREEITQKKEELEKARKDAYQAQKLLSKQRNIAYLVGNFIMQYRKDIFNNIVKDKEFDNTIKENKYRTLFGFSILEKEKKVRKSTKNQIEQIKNLLLEKDKKITGYTKENITLITLSDISYETAKAVIEWLNSDDKNSDKNNETNVHINVASEKQISFIKDLIRQKHVDIKEFNQQLDENNISTLDKKTATELIEWLQNK